MKKKLLVGTFLSLLALYTAFCLGFGYGDAKHSTGTNVSLDTAQQVTAEKLWVETNKQRSQAGKGTLLLSPELMQSSKLKCDDMVKRDYFEHNSPDGKEPWQFFDMAGVSATKEGENLAEGNYTAESVTDAWMQSETHRKNILDDKFSEVGYAVCDSPNLGGSGPTTLIVQHFSQPR